MKHMRVAGAMAVVFICVVAWSRDATAETAIGNPWRLAAGPIVGGVAFDKHLADYRWDIRPALQAGVQLTAYRGHLGTGLRLWRARTTQESGIPGDGTAPRVALTALETFAQLRVTAYRGIELWGSAHTGILHLGYDPDRLSFDTGGTGGVVTVDYKPISEWDFGAGVELRREIVRRMALSLQGQYTGFSLDTAHRRGNDIVNARERFGIWHLRLQAAWLVSFR